MKNVTLALLVTSALGVAGCNSTDIHFSGTLHPETAFSLQSKSGLRLRFEANKAEVADVTYSGSKDTVTLDVRGEKVIFEGAKYDKETNRVIAPAADSKQTLESGEKVGFVSHKDLVCTPDCERRAVREEDRECTRYEHREVQRCWSDHHGHMVCRWYWEDIPVRGYQHVRVTDITRQFLYTGEILTETSLRIGVATAEDSETNSSVEPLSACW